MCSSTAYPLHTHTHTQQRTMECGLTSSVSGPVISKPAYGKGKRVVDQRLAQPPTNGGSRNSRSSVSSTDSGFGPSTDGEVSRQPFVTVETKKSLSTPSSADGKLKYGKQQKGHSDGGCFEGRGNQNGHENMHNYSWFWDTLSRTETENKLQTEGKVGNFVVRINAEGSYVMSVWYVLRVLSSVPSGGVLGPSNEQFVFYYVACMHME